jgi:hypothetical protein
MFQIIFASVLGIVVISRYFDWIVHNEKPDTKNILLLVLCSLFVIAVYLEKVFLINI